MSKANVVLGLIGANLDRGGGRGRWERWRPTVDLCRQEDMVVDRLELLHGASTRDLARQVAGDVRAVSPETEVRLHAVDFEDPWDFEEVYGNLFDFVRAYHFDPDRESYLVHITTGTHVAQICLFLLTESRHLPGRLLQTSPPPSQAKDLPGRYAIIDLDLSRYDRLASRFAVEQAEGLSFLKSGIETRNPAFNTLIERIERVAVASREPILLTGPTGAGKSHLAKRIHALKRARKQISGRFVEVNCATIRGDGAMSALFGHVKGAYTGAVGRREGLLLAADRGVLLLDEIGELGLDEQAMLLRAIEDRTFLPVGSEQEVSSDFQLIAGTNRDLAEAVRAGRFREDLLARIDLWTFRLPGLTERREDIEPNLDFELARWAERTGQRVTMNAQARARFLAYAMSPAARWPGNFRTLNAAVTRMATLAPGARIDEATVDEELARLEPSPAPAAPSRVDAVLGPDAALDLFDRAQLEAVLEVCARARTLSEAGRALFAVSRAKKRSSNDADRLKKYLARFGLTFADVRGSG